MEKGTLLALVLLLGWLACTGSLDGWVNYDKSVVIRQPPVQSETIKSPFEHKGFTITPKARFSIEARILSKRRYFWGAESKISPVDYALGWGPMSNYQVLKDLKIYQLNRWYFYRYKELPIMQSEITRNSANMHLIPATKKVAKKIKKARKGKIVRLKGHLVYVTKENGWHWYSSLTRTDSGNGSCEVVWVEDIEVL